MKLAWVATAGLLLTGVNLSGCGGDDSPSKSTGSTDSTSSGGSGAEGSSIASGGSESSSEGGAQSATGGAESGGSGGTGGFAGSADVSCDDSEGCPASQHCSEGVCRADECSAGTERCNGNGIERCDEEGAGYDTREVCESRQTCSENDGDASCEDWVCTPDALECQTDRIAIECSEGGTSIVNSVDCGDAGEFCVEGECADQLCEPNELYCQGAELRLCAEDGESSTLETACDDGEYCDDGTQECASALCDPGQPACDGNVLTTCNGEGSGYSDGGTDCGDQRCTPSGCVDGFFEDFEDGDFLGWVLIDGTITPVVTEDWAAAGTNKSLEISEYTLPFEALNYVFEEPIRPTYVSYWARSSTTSVGNTVFVFSGSTEPALDNRLYYQSFSNGRMSVYNGPSLGYYEVNAWYHIEVELDWDARTIAVSLDGAYVDTGNLTADSESIAMLSLWSGNATSYWDEIEIR